MPAESPGFANAASFYGAEQSRRAWFTWLPRDGSNDIGSAAGGLRVASDCAVTAPVSGMSVNVAAGEMLIAGSSTTSQGAYYGLVSSTVNLPIAASSPSNPRVDLVCATIDDSAYLGSADDFKLQVITGVPTTGATLGNLTGAPVLPASSLALAYVLAPTSATNIITADIKNVAQPAFGLGGGAMRCYYSSGTTNITVGGVQIPFDVASFDPGSNFSASGHVYGCPADGLYLAIAGLQVTLPATGTTTITLSIENNTLSTGAVGTTYTRPTAAAAASQQWNGLATDIIKCNQGDLIGVVAANSSGTAVAASGALLTYMSVVRVG